MAAETSISGIIGGLREGPLSALTSTQNSGIGSSPESLAFPENEIINIDHWVIFRAFETKQLNRRAAGTREDKTAIMLPMPGNLSTAYNINYADTDLIGVNNTIIESLGIGEDAAAIRGEAGASTFGAALGSAVGLAAGGGAVAALVGTVIGATSGSLREGGSGINGVAASAISQTGSLGAAVAGQRGIAVNPHKVLLFQNVGFRAHQFNYAFTPKNYAEAETLRKIIAKFKYYASPSFANDVQLIDGQGGPTDIRAGKHFFKYPEYFEIRFHHPNFLFQLGPSVIESFSVDYHPAGIPTYAREKGKEPTPTQINMSITFRETDIVTKDNIMSENR